ncbi:MAG: helix-turn-helix domain-containing protein [Syntrophales bacterium]|nr:helix-turn-helix domain-containing protein [Syntrophales bacterium]MDD5533704.1 helix-turn-helix domain-containing protein [Syntrophales bacterium]HPL64531.1 helix-turn-helix domain-containing protein [Syntrophales bacterium]
MEKICIVKRRKSEEDFCQGGRGTADVPSKAHARDIFVPEEIKPGEDRIISVRFNTIREGTVSHGPLRAVPDASPGTSFVFNFHFKTVPADAARMLKPEEVRHMLQISSSRLSGLLRSGELRSFRIGRLRRFALADILNFLTRADGPPENVGSRNIEE